MPEVTTPTERKQTASRPTATAPYTPSMRSSGGRPHHIRSPHDRRPRRITHSEHSRGVHEAGIRHNTAPNEIEAVLARRPTQPGARELRRVLRGDVHVTLSALERRSSKLLREAGLPLPITNRPAGGRYVDCRWPEHAPHRRARRLPLPPLPPRLGAGPPPRARGLRPRRRVPPLHVRRRLRRPRPMLAELRAVLPESWRDSAVLLRSNDFSGADSAPRADGACRARRRHPPAPGRRERVTRP